MNSNEFDILLKKFLAGNCTKEEEAKVLTWYRAIYDDKREALSPDERMALEELLWASLKTKIMPQATERHPPMGEKDVKEIGPQNNLILFWFSPMAKLAATVLLFAGLAIVFFVVQSRNDGVKQVTAAANPVDVNNMIKVTNSGKEVQIINLEDGTRIALKPKSEFSYPQHFATNRRDVKLVGEAFFDVAKDPKRPFFVYSNEVITKVLGTSFNIVAYEEDKEIAVSVVSGRVSVSTPPGAQASTKSAQREVILTPNQEAIYDRKNDSMRKELVAQPMVIAEKHLLKMKYTNASVVEIFDELNSAYGVDIQFNREKLKRCTITTDLSHETLYERIEVICHALDAKYKIVNASILITINGNGCK